MAADPERRQSYLRMFESVLPMTAGIRRAGSAALDLAYVAAGRLDGYWEAKLKPWDIAAGVLLVQEAGGFVTDFNGADQYLQSGNLIVGAPAVQHELLDIFQAERTRSCWS
jgi:myo-inositol-1(or 4)-monophosphatase